MKNEHYSEERLLDLETTSHPLECLNGSSKCACQTHTTNRAIERHDDFSVWILPPLGLGRHHFAITHDFRRDFSGLLGRRVMFIVTLFDKKNSPWSRTWDFCRDIVSAEPWLGREYFEEITLDNTIQSRDIRNDVTNARLKSWNPVFALPIVGDICLCNAARFVKISLSRL